MATATSTGSADGALNAEAAVARLLERLRAGQDALLLGAPDPLRQVLATAGAALAGEARPLRAAAAAGGLSLSGLMAQLSAQDDLGAHDDAVLEEVHRLLSGAGAPDGRVVLLLDAAEGLHRPVLQYLQHAVRTLPGLRLVLAAERVPEAVEEAPALAGLRARLLDAGPIAVLPSPPAPVPAPRRAPLAAAAPTPPVVRRGLVALPDERLAPAPRRTARAALTWAAVGVGMAASLVAGLVLGHATAPGREAEAVLPILQGLPPLARATVPPPASAAIPGAGLASRPPPDLAAAAAAPVAKGAPPELAKPAAAPLPLPPKPTPPMTIALMQEGAAEPGWSGPAKLLGERDPPRRGRASRSRPGSPAEPAATGANGLVLAPAVPPSSPASLPLPSFAPPPEGAAPEPLLSPAEIARVRRHFQRAATRPPWRRHWDPDPNGPPADEPPGYPPLGYSPPGFPQNYGSWSDEP